MFRDQKHLKFIDFGFFRHGHSLHDLIYLLYTSTQTRSVSEVCEYYRQNLQKNLHKLDLDLDFHTFKTELRKTAESIFPLAIKVIKTVKRGAAKQQQIDHAKFVLRKLQDGCDDTLQTTQRTV